MSLVKFVGEMERFSPGHLIVGRPFDMDGCLTAPWWAAPFVRGQRALWFWLMKKSRVNRWEMELKKASLHGYHKGFEEGQSFGIQLQCATAQEILERMYALQQRDQPR